MLSPVFSNMTIWFIPFWCMRMGVKWMDESIKFELIFSNKIYK